MTNWFTFIFWWVDLNRNKTKNRAHVNRWVFSTYDALTNMICTIMCFLWFYHQFSAFNSLSRSLFFSLCECFYSSICYTKASATSKGLKNPIGSTIAMVMMPPTINVFRTKFVLNVYRAGCRWIEQIELALNRLFMRGLYVIHDGFVTGTSLLCDSTTTTAKRTWKSDRNWIWLQLMHVSML